ncbi:HAD hydrolase-like protein [Acidothermaceae bacterium B102]|nr:HAD hydrolase-like protein [Acidothermaceae bacterium B102]
MPAGVDDGSHDSAPSQLTLAARYDVALLDLDGVVYRGADPVPGAPQALSAARAAGMRLAFVTNNASRPPEAVAHHLVELGVDARPDEVVTSAQAASAMLVDLIGPGGLVLVVGGVGLRTAVAEVGLVAVPSYDAVPAPQAVIQGFSPDLQYEDLVQATFAVAAGATWVATNTDTTIPTSRGLQPGNGTLVAAVAAATGQRPLVAGKPERALVDEAVRRSGATRPLCVGDRLDTDIEGAVRAGLDSLLVLTGVSSLADLLAAPPERRPTYFAADLTALATSPVPLADLPAAPAQARSGWRAETDGTHIAVSREPGTTGGDLWDAVRLLVVAGWALADMGERLDLLVVPDDLSAVLLEAGVPQSLIRVAGRDNDGVTATSTDRG